MSVSGEAIAESRDEGSRLGLWRFLDMSVVARWIANEQMFNKKGLI